MPALSIMIKPASSLCNMRCRYCFYHNVADIRTVESFGIMTENTAENLIKKALSFADGENISFAFQGGEPLLAGLDFFRSFVGKVNEHNHRKSNIYYGIQTNGTLISGEWCDFFKENNFLVGLSLDGNFKNNRFRVDDKKENTFYRVMESARLLEKKGIPFNILTVLTGNCADNIENIYKFFKKQKFRYLQFIPCLRPFGDKSEGEMWLTEKQYENFLIKCFKLYVKDFSEGNYTSIRFFDNIVSMYLGKRPEQCGLCGYCTHQFVAEGNGNIYPCDFYCTDEWLLGNINETDMKSIAESEKAKEFIRESLDIREECRLCRYYPLCRGGGCKRNRADRNYCEAYKAFYNECLPLFRIFLKLG